METIDYLLIHFPDECKHFITKHLSRYNKEHLISLINNMDANYPSQGFDYGRISNNRKQFIVKLIDSRISFIFQKVQEYGHEI